MKILLNSTPAALWYDVVCEAEANCALNLKAELESYLVFLLVRYIDKPEIAKKILATQFLNATKKNSQEQMMLLQEVGDECLLFTGLFPKIVEKRHLKISYFVNLGQSAYSTISKNNNDLYDSLAKHFVPLMDILQSVRQYAKECPDLLPLEAYDLWSETGSQRALRTLKQYTQATPIQIDTIKRERK